jgi:hypothetical protein
VNRKVKSIVQQNQHLPGPCALGMAFANYDLPLALLSRVAEYVYSITAIARSDSRTSNIETSHSPGTRPMKHDA